MNPGDLCAFVPGDHGTLVQHHAPCPDGHPTGAITAPGSMTVIRFAEAATPDRSGRD